MDVPTDIASLGPLATHAADALEGIARASSWVRAAGLWAQGTLLVAGAVSLTVLGRAERAMSGLGGALAGALVALAFRSAILVHVGMGPRFAVPVAAALAGALSAALPRLFPFIAAALPGFVAGLEIPLAGHAWAGGVAVGLAAGFVSAAFARGVGVAFVSLAGGLALSMAAAAMLDGHAWAAAIAARPLVLCGFAIVLGVAGTAYQVPVRPRPSGQPAAMPPELDRTLPY